MAYSCMYNRLTVAELEEIVYLEHKKALSESDHYLIDHLNKIIESKKV